MTACTLLPMVWLVLLWFAVPLAQDPVKVDSGHYRVVLENETLRVLRVVMAPGAKSPMHQHPDAVVISMRSARVRFATPDGKADDLELAAESAMYRPAETHSPSNIGSRPLQALIVEFKSPTPGKATLPPSRPGLEMKVLVDSPRALVYRTTAEPAFHEPADSKHDFDQLVIALGPGQLTLSIQNKPARTTWARGDVVFIARGVPHEARNTGGKPIDFIMVAIR